MRVCVTRVGMLAMLRFSVRLVKKLRVLRRSFRGLGLRDRRYLVSAIWFLTYARQLLVYEKEVDLRRLIPPVSPGPGIEAPSEAAQREIDQVCWAVSEVALIWNSECLETSLAKALMLHANSIVVQLVIGVVRVETSIMAHAWIERGLEPVDDSLGFVRQYEPILSLPVA